MKIIEPSVRLIDPPSYIDALRRIEQAGRVCYKSEGKISDTSAEQFVRNIIQRGHEAVLEHVSITAHIICDRGVSHELVRHRLASYCQESTRYCNYSKDKFGAEITVIEPTFQIPDGPDLRDNTKAHIAYSLWRYSMEQAEGTYLAMLCMGCTPQTARSVLPNSLKTEVFMSTNIREWRHFLKARMSTAAHPDMYHVACMVYTELCFRYPVFFEDIKP